MKLFIVFVYITGGEYSYISSGKINVLRWDVVAETPEDFNFKS
jgi:hypothetical protein